MTYQAASGAGAKNMRELVSQMGVVHGAAAVAAGRPGHPRSSTSIARVTDTLRSSALPTEQFGYPLAGSLLPWIDKDLGNGQSKEEWKAMAEGNKILGRAALADPDGRPLRPHRLDALPQPGAHGEAARATCRSREIERCSPPRTNGCRSCRTERDDSLRELTPAAVSGTLHGADRPPAQAGDGAAST